MKKFVIFSVFALLAVSLTQVAGAGDLEISSDYYLLHADCANVINEQVSWELYASIVYLNMGAYFDRPSVARNGYAKYFRDQSLEEYQHAGKFIDYLNSRNATLRPISIDESSKNEWSSPREALADAIKLEKHVFAKLQYLHDVAEQKCLDSHLTDFLEGHFFTEQVESIQELQTMLSKISVADKTAASVIEHITDDGLKKKSKKEDL